ncbi:hypothetical protein HAX54_048985 [Datura stramonium]|uniref:ABC transporter domain-containing protein n=1 Tax=Datura stramonium TaxID=4076 RepID=A0ABS8WJZ7_DATST|nr:hypothetical protein [Datura stramonium]
MALPKFLRRGVKGEELPFGDNMKVLLNDISGEAREGEIMAVLGASGSGKSTLIDALADRISRESLKGNVTLNGEVLESKILKVISAYVMQDDLLFPMLTVEETLMFSAEFRLPRTLSKSKKKARVLALIDQLGLKNAAKTVIGDEGHRGVSGGRKKAGHTVFTSPPSSLQQFFAEFGNPIPENENRIEFALDFIRELEGTPNGTKNLMEFNRTWQRKKNSTTNNNISNVPKFANPFWVDMVVIAKRSMLNSMRMPELFVGLAGGISGFLFFLLFMVASFWAGSSFVTFLSGVIYNVMMAYTVVVAILAYFRCSVATSSTRDRILLTGYGFSLYVTSEIPFIKGC